MNLHLRKFDKRLIHYCRSVSKYWKYKRISKNFKNTGNKGIVLELTDPFIYHRHFYTLLIFFQIAEIPIFFPSFNLSYYRKNIYSLRHSHWKYFNWIFEDGLLSYSIPPKDMETIRLTDDNLSPDYFSYLRKDRDNNEYYFIPMTMHPTLYKLNLWKAPVKTINKKKSVFAIGNFSPEAYNFLNFKKFPLPNRISLLNHLKQKSFFESIRTKNQLNDFITANKDHKCILIDVNHFNIQQYELRDYLSNFYFFLAIPGESMPICHNIIEAMSVGCIPIIHENYANLFHPSLKNSHNSLIYKDLDELEILISSLPDQTLDFINKMSYQVLNYYTEHLTPEAVINSIIHKNHSLYLLNAAQESVRIFQSH